jgi:hypothetical protein
MRDWIIAIVGGLLSWALVIGGGVWFAIAGAGMLGNMGQFGLPSPDRGKIIAERGFAADQPASMGDVVRFNIPKGFELEYPDDGVNRFDPETYADTELAQETYVLAPFGYDEFPPDGRAPYAARLVVIAADPASNVIDMARESFTGSAALPPHGDIEILRAEFGDMVSYVALDGPRGRQVELSVGEPDIYDDDQARTILIGAIDSMEVDQEKFTALLEAARARQAAYEQARDEAQTAAGDFLMQRLGMVFPDDGGVGVSKAGDVHDQGQLFLKLATKPGAGDAQKGQAVFSLVKPVPTDMNAPEAMDFVYHGLAAIWRDTKGTLWIQFLDNPPDVPPSLVADYGPPGLDESLARQVKAGEVSLWRPIETTSIYDQASLEGFQTQVNETLAWREKTSPAPWKPAP